MRRREALQRIGRWVTAGGALLAPAARAEPASPFRRPDVQALLASLFPGRQVEAASGIGIEGPEITDDGAHVPLSLHLGQADARPDRLALIAPDNPHPLVAVLQPGARLAGPLALRVKLARSQTVLLLAAAGPRLYGASAFLRVVSSGCNPAADDPAPPADLGAIRFRHDPPRDGLADARLLLRHPMRVELRDGPVARRRAAEHVERLELDIDGQPLLHMDCGQSVAADPYLAFRLQPPRPGETLEIRWRDNHGRSGEARFPLGSGALSAVHRGHRL